MAHLTAENRRAATVEVAFQTVTDRFMEQHARPARAQHDRQRAGRCRHRAEVHQRHAHRFSRPGFSTYFAVGILHKPLVAETAAAAAGAALALAVFFHLYAHGKAHQRAHVSRQRTVRRRHQNQFIDAGQARAYFLDALVGGARGVIDTAQNIELFFTAHALQRIERGIERRIIYSAQGLNAPFALLAHDAARGLRALLQRQQANLIGVSEAGFLAADGAYANALVDIVRAVFDDTVF